MGIKGSSVACVGSPFGATSKVYSGFRGEPAACSKSKQRRVPGASRGKGKKATTQARKGDVKKSPMFQTLTAVSGEAKKQYEASRWHVSSLDIEAMFQRCHPRHARRHLVAVQQWSGAGEALQHTWLSTHTGAMAKLPPSWYLRAMPRLWTRYQCNTRKK